MELIECCKKLDIEYMDIMSRFGNNEMMYIRFLKKFLEDKTYVALENAWKNKDYVEIEKTAHTLKGIIANLGINRLYVLTNEMVQAVREKQYERLEDIYTKIQKEYEETKECIEKIN